MEPYITLSFLNDFIFCPRSIYFHQLYGGLNHELYKQKPQIAGTAAHKPIGDKSYAHAKIFCRIWKYFQRNTIFVEKLMCSIARRASTERKREIKTIYDGYVFQVYAQCHALREMGYAVNEIVIHDLVHNKNYPIPLPENNLEMQMKFEKLIQGINCFKIDSAEFEPNRSKCERCIYSQLCDVSPC